MDTKWKSSKFFVVPAVLISMAAAIVFMSFFPFFVRRAEEDYVNPLIQQDFLQDLMSANYVQYKYLREKTDQTEYDYCELYLSCETFYGEMDEEQRELYGIYSEEEPPAQSLSSRLHDNFCSQFQDSEAFLAELGERMDYYVQDLSLGDVISNSGSSLSKAVYGDQTEEETAENDAERNLSAANDYIYYVSMDYDAAGNVTNVRVRCSENARQLLSRVQTAGHEKLIYLPQLDGFYEEPGGRAAVCYTGGGTDGAASLRISLLAPSNMRVIYGMTQQQYTRLTTGQEESLDYFSTLNIRRADFYQAGTGDIYLLMLAVCAISGILTGLYWRRRSVAGDPEGGMAFLCRIYMEVWIAIAAIPVFFQGYIVNCVYEYENNLFLRNIRAGLGKNGRLLSFIRLDQIAMFLLLAGLFALMTLAGIGLSGIGRRNLRDRSLICRYWRRIYQTVRELCIRFYMEIVCYDIGTNANRIILKVLTVNFMVLLVICSFWFAGIFGLIIYSVIIYFILKRYVMDIQEKYSRLLHATRSIAQGNLDTALYEDFGVFESYKSELRQIQADFKHAVEEEVKSQRMKSELITNVSHDLKTPLTAIITYIDLLKEPDVPEEKRKEYLDILQRKADRLKILIEDLFEISKASSKTVSLQIVEVDICNLLRQVYLEQEDRAAAAGLDFKFNLPEERQILPLDSQKTYRIFDNLYTNIIKYAMPGTRVYIHVYSKRDEVAVELKNISAAELTMDPGELTERFVRGDGSRNTEGSGLGLAIAKSFAELQGGSMQISFDGDLFKCLLRFSRMPSGAKWKDTKKHSEESGTQMGREEEKGSMPGGAFGAMPSKGYSSGVYQSRHSYYEPAGGYRDSGVTGFPPYGNGSGPFPEKTPMPEGSFRPGASASCGEPMYGQNGYVYPGYDNQGPFGDTPYEDPYENPVMYGRRNIRDSSILNGWKKRRREKEKNRAEERELKKRNPGSSEKGFPGRKGF